MDDHSEVLSERRADSVSGVRSTAISRTRSANARGGVTPTRLLSVLWFTKLLGNTGLRIFYPLAPYLTENWGVSRADMGVILAAAEIAAVPAIFIAPFGDIYGTRVLTLVMWALVAVGSWMVLLPKILGVLLFGRIVFNFGYTVFQVTAQSIIVDNVSEGKRDWATGLIESSWSMSILVCIPLFTFIYSQAGDAIMFIVLASLMSVSLVSLFAFLPANTDAHEDEKVTFRTALWICMTQIAATLFNISCVFVNFSHNAVFTAFAFWAKDEFEVSVEDLGSSLFVVGAAELVGVIGVSYLSDRLGIYNGLYITCILFAIFIFCLPFSPSYIAALIFMFLIYIPGEYLIVLGISEIEAYVQPEIRTTLLGVNFTYQFVGRAAGAYLGEVMYAGIGIFGVCSVSAASCLVAALFLYCACQRKSQLHNDSTAENQIAVENEDAQCNDKVGKEKESDTNFKLNGSGHAPTETKMNVA